MARPRLDDEDRRALSVTVRVTAAELAELEERAAAASLRRSAYMRLSSLGQPVRVSTVHRLGAAERLELQRIGVNLNQVARAMNAGAPPPDDLRESIEGVGELLVALLTGEALG